jgi:hypothetical protein
MQFLSVSMKKSRRLIFTGAIDREKMCKEGREGKPYDGFLMRIILCFASALRLSSP